MAKRMFLKGHEVKAITCNTEKSLSIDEYEGVHIFRLPSWNILGGTYPVPKPSISTARLLRAACNGHVDIINTQTRFFLTSLLGMVVSKVKKAYLVHTERGTCHSVVVNKAVNLVARLYDHTMGRLVVQSARVNVGVSASACKFVEHLGGKRTEVIYNGIDHDVFIQSRARPVLCGNVITIVYVGRLVYAKGVQDLIKAFQSRWWYKDKIVRLVIVGDGNYRLELARMAGGNPMIIFTGELDQAGVSGVLNRSDIFVNPSYSEGLPTSVMEAASVGLPIIATNVGGTEEIIENGKSGILIQPGSEHAIARALEYILSDKCKAQELGKEAQQRAKLFSWDKIANEWEKTLKGVVE